MRFARLLLPLLLAAPARAAELRHRLYIAPDEMAAMDTHTLAKLLVERIHRECDLAVAPASGEKVQALALFRPPRRAPAGRDQPHPG